MRWVQGRLSDPARRRAAGRWLLAGTAAGMLLSAWWLGTSRLAFVAIVWIALVYVPARILIEVAASGGGRARPLAPPADPYRSRNTVTSFVEYLYDREITMPRIVGRRMDEKVRRPAVEIVLRALRADPAALPPAAVRAIQVAEWGTARLGETLAQPIQERWGRIRAVAGSAALASLLVAVCEDRAGQPFIPGGPAAADVRAFVEACFDYCDQVGLDLPGPAWESPALAPALPDADAGAVLDAYGAYVDTPDPAPTPLARFVNALTAGPPDATG